jgi:two-component sensor histidine kinase
MYDPTNDPAFLRSVLASSGDCIKVLDLHANLVFMTEAGQRLMEVSDFNAIRGCPWPGFWKDAGNAAAKAAVDAARAGGVGRFQGEASTMAGTVKFWDVQVTPILGPDGKPEKLLSVSRDITEQKVAQDRQAMLHLELAHRVKNTLAMVQAIAFQTMRGDATLEEARETFTSRLAVLAKANDVLLQASWTEASFKSLVEASAQVHGGGSARFQLDGPEVRIGPKAALSFALALHELGTNALKYGALSNDGGRVDITWRVSDDPSPNLSFEWAEKGGPVVKPPTKTGFGSRLIDRMLASSLGAEVKLEYAPTGVRLTVEGPVAAMQNA